MSEVISATPARSRKALAPLLLLLMGLGLAAYFGYDYVQQTWLVHNRSLPQYNASRKLWIPIPAVGTQIGEVDIPALNLSDPVIQGTDTPQLKLGIGHYTTSALPGQTGNIVLAGHRDTVFLSLRKLKQGDKITVNTAYGPFVYEADQFRVVPGNDVGVLAPAKGQQLTLITCYPFYFFGFAPDRYIVTAKLVSQPKGIG